MGRKKNTNTELKRMVIAECPDYKHHGKCIWDKPCNHFTEADENCHHFDQFIPHYKEMYAKEKTRKSISVLPTNKLLPEWGSWPL